MKPGALFFAVPAVALSAAGVVVFVIAGFAFVGAGVTLSPVRNDDKDFECPMGPLNLFWSRSAAGM